METIDMTTEQTQGIESVRTEFIDFNQHPHFTAFAQSKGLTSLPTGILSKSYCGIGITYYFVNKMLQPLKIVVMPTQKLVIEKAKICDVFIMQGVNKSTVKGGILNALYNKEACSIATTYEGLSKLVPILQELHNEGVLKGSNLHVLCDEYHALTMDVSYKDSYDNEVPRQINALKQLGANITYTSATPTNDQQTADFLKDLPVTHLQSVNTITQRVKAVLVPKKERQTTSLFLSTIIHFIKLKRKKGLNVYVFFNSVAQALKIAKTMNLDPKKVNFICSKEQLSRLENNGFAWCGENIQDDKIRHYNFITCASFEGVDFVDPKGVAIIVSPYIQTDEQALQPKKLVQVLGRIKDPTKQFEKTLTHQPVLIYHRTTFIPKEWITSTQSNVSFLENFIPQTLNDLNKKKRLYHETKRSKKDYLTTKALDLETSNFYNNLTSGEIRYTLNDKVLKTGYFLKFEHIPHNTLNVEVLELEDVVKLDFLEAQTQYNELMTLDQRDKDQQKQYKSILKDYPALSKVKAPAFETYNKLLQSLESNEQKLLNALRMVRDNPLNKVTGKQKQTKIYVRGATIPVEQIQNDVQRIIQKLGLTFEGDPQPLTLFKQVFETQRIFKNKMTKVTTAYKIIGTNLLHVGCV